MINTILDNDYDNLYIQIENDQRVINNLYNFIYFLLFIVLVFIGLVFSMMQEIKISMETTNMELNLKLDRIKDRLVILANLVDSIKSSNVTDVTEEPEETDETELTN